MTEEHDPRQEDSVEEDEEDESGPWAKTSSGDADSITEDEDQD